jgi:queuine/archaeosine tRNA-ribosyltransferase
MRNGLRFMRQHHLGQFAFTPIGAVQGWHGHLFRYAVERFLAWGYQYLAIGGLAKAKTEEILEVLRAIQPALADAPGVDVHLFGVARNDQVDKFIQLGVTSCDSTGPLQKAWLNATANYLTIDGPTYAAIRIPNPDSSPKGKKAVNEEAGVTLRYLLSLEREVLRMVRAFDRGEVGVEETLDAIMSYDELLGEDRKFRELFRKTLTDQPWKKCPCDVCRKVGVDVIIFRGNDRNRRRGFHNTYVYYQEFKRIRERLDDNNRIVQEIQSAIPAPEKPAARMAFEF